MSKYVPIYRCLLCGQIGQSPWEYEPMELEKRQAEVLAQGLGDSSNKHPRARERVPYASAHDCWNNGKNIGVAVFAGFARVAGKTKEEKDV